MNRQPTVYLICLAVSVLLGASALLFANRRRVFSGAVMAVLSLLLGYLGGRLVYLLIKIASLWPQYGLTFLFTYTHAQLAATGVMAGASLGVALGAALCGHSAKEALDRATPALLLTLALCRFSEYFAGIGVGRYVMTPWQQFFPLAVVNQYGEWYYAIFMLEGALALIVLLITLKRTNRFMCAMLLVCLAQIYCESLRAEALRWGFVRAQQAICAGAGLLLLLCCALRRKKGALCCVIWVIGLCLISACEFALDKSTLPKALIYLSMALTLTGMGTAGLRLLSDSCEN